VSRGKKISPSPPEKTRVRPSKKKKARVVGGGGGGGRFKKEGKREVI